MGLGNGWFAMYHQNVDRPLLSIFFFSYLIYTNLSLFTSNTYTDSLPTADGSCR